MTAAAIPASHRDLLEAPGVAAFTTIGASGYPQTSAIWYLLDGDVIRTSLQKSRQKYSNLVADPKASLLIIDPANPMRTIEIRGDVTLADEHDASQLRLVAAHYGAPLERFPLGDRAVMTLTPRRVRVTG